MKEDQRSPEEMIVYTRTGDGGKTNLYDTTHVYKDEPRVVAYGTIDELNSFIGLAKHYVEDPKTVRLLHDLQRKLFDVGAELATVDVSVLKTTLQQEDVDFLEDTIDDYLKTFETPTYFIIPGDNLASAYLHVCRTVCRRAERLMVPLYKHGEISDTLLKYVNRLSDLFYALSRFVEETYEKVEF